MFLGSGLRCERESDKVIIVYRARNRPILKLDRYESEQYTPDAPTNTDLLYSIGVFTKDQYLLRPAFQGLTRPESRSATLFLREDHTVIKRIVVIVVYAIQKYMHKQSR